MPKIFALLPNIAEQVDKCFEDKTVEDVRRFENSIRQYAADTGLLMKKNKGTAISTIEFFKICMQFQIAVSDLGLDTKIRQRLCALVLKELSRENAWTGGAGSVFENQKYCYYWIYSAEHYDVCADLFGPKKKVVTKPPIAGAPAVAPAKAPDARVAAIEARVKAAADAKLPPPATPLAHPTAGDAAFKPAPGAVMPPTPPVVDADGIFKPPAPADVGAAVVRAADVDSFVVAAMAGEAFIPAGDPPTVEAVIEEKKKKVMKKKKE